jgi:hypothetical protein
VRRLSGSQRVHLTALKGGVFDDLEPFWEVIDRNINGAHGEKLAAYAQDGIFLSRIFQGSTDATMFEDFISQLLQHRGKWPEEKSVLVMNKAFF